MKNYYVGGLPFLALLLISPLYAIDLQPGEVRALKPGINFIQLAYQRSQRGARYLHGDKQPGDSVIQTTQAQVRLGHSFELGGYPAVFYVQTPMGYIHPKGSLSGLEGDTGVGDTTLVQAFWPYANHDTQTYFGVAAYEIIPTGSYNSERNFNLGENRYRWALQAGYQSPLTKQLQWMTAVDVTWFGENDEFGYPRDTLKRQALSSGQLGLQYNFSPNYVLAASYFYTAGGKTSVNNISREDETQSHRYQLSGVINLAFGRLTLQYGGELQTENGYIEDRRWIVRYTKFF